MPVKYESVQTPSSRPGAPSDKPLYRVNSKERLTKYSCTNFILYLGPELSLLKQGLVNVAHTFLCLTNAEITGMYQHT